MIGILNACLAEVHSSNDPLEAASSSQTVVLLVVAIVDMGDSVDEVEHQHGQSVGLAGGFPDPTVRHVPAAPRHGRLEVLSEKYGRE